MLVVDLLVNQKSIELLEENVRKTLNLGQAKSSSIEHKKILKHHKGNIDK